MPSILYHFITNQLTPKAAQLAELPRPFLQNAEGLGVSVWDSSSETMSRHIQKLVCIYVYVYVYVCIYTYIHRLHDVYGIIVL